MPDDILDRLTWQDVSDLNAYWKSHPPLQWMVQGYLGIKIPDDVDEPEQTAEGSSFFDSMSPENFTAFLLAQKHKFN